MKKPPAWLLTELYAYHCHSFDEASAEVRALAWRHRAHLNADLAACAAGIRVPQWSPPATVEDPKGRNEVIELAGTSRYYQHLQHEYLRASRTFERGIWFWAGGGEIDLPAGHEGQVIPCRWRRWRLSEFRRYAEIAYHYDVRNAERWLREADEMWAYEDGRIEQARAWPQYRCSQCRQIYGETTDPIYEECECGGNYIPPE